MPDNYDGMDPDFASKLQAMVAASGGKIWINSGYRSNERQAQLYQNAIQQHGAANARQWVAPPGHSNHNFGLAADLGGDLPLAHSLAPTFGLRFPMGWEPWHVEPPGARSKRGADYPQSQTEPRAGFQGVDTSDPYSEIGTQLHVFNELLRGKTGADIEAELGQPTQTGEAQGTGAGRELRPGLTQAETHVAGGGRANPADIYAALIQQGVDPVHAAALTAIAGRESGFRVNAYNGDESTGDNSHGLFQINTLGGQHSQYELGSFEGQIAAAADMVKSGGLQPWGPYKGVSWANNVDLGVGVSASGGQVSEEDLHRILQEGL